MAAIAIDMGQNPFPALPDVSPNTRFGKLNPMRVFHHRQLLKEAHKLNLDLDTSEKGFSTEKATELQAKCQQCMQKISHAEYVSPELQESYKGLRSRVCALKYRALSEQEQAENAMNSNSYESLRQAVSARKKSHSVISQLYAEDQELTKSEEEILGNLATKYPSVASLIMQDEAMLSAFFTYVIFRGIPLDVFVQFPNTVTKLSSLVTARLGYFTNFLRVEEQANGPKTLTIPYRHRDGNLHRVNILDSSSQLHLEHNITISVAQLYEHLIAKAIKMGPVEIFPDGIRAFDSGQFAMSSPIDLTQPDWFRQLPAFETLTTAEANNKYGRFMHGKALDGKNWMLALCAAAKDKNVIDLTGVHAYEVLLIPSGDGKSYKTIPLGKFPKICPDVRSQKAMVGFVVNTQLGEIQYDVNYFTDSRVHGMLCFSLPKDQGEYYMNEILKKDLQASSAGNLLFQFPDQNCTEWVISRWEKLHQDWMAKHPGYKQPFPTPQHRVSLINTTPSNPALGCVVNKLRAMSEKVRRAFTSVLLFLLGARRGKMVDGNYYSVWTSKKFTQPDYEIGNPVPFFGYNGAAVGQACPEANNPHHRCVRLTPHRGI